MTRAAHAALHGRFGEAFRFNPLGMILLPVRGGRAWGSRSSAGCAASRCHSACGSALARCVDARGRGGRLLGFAEYPGVAVHAARAAVISLAGEVSLAGAAIAALLPPMPLLLGVNIDHVATLRQARYATDAGLAECRALPGRGRPRRARRRGGFAHASMSAATAATCRMPMPSGSAPKCKLPLEFRNGRDRGNGRHRAETQTGLRLPRAGDRAWKSPPRAGSTCSPVSTRPAWSVARLQDAGIRVSLFIDPGSQASRSRRRSLRRHDRTPHRMLSPTPSGDAVETELDRLIAAAKARPCRRPPSECRPRHQLHQYHPASERFPISRNSTSATASSPAPPASA